MRPVVDKVKLCELQKEAAEQQNAAEIEQSFEVDIRRHTPTKMKGDIGAGDSKEGP